MEQQIITGIAFARDEAQITLRGVKDSPGIAAAIFGPLADASINVDMIIQTVSGDQSTTDMTFTVPAADYQRARAVLDAVDAAVEAFGGANTGVVVGASPILLALLGRVVASDDVPEQSLRFPPRHLRRPDSMPSDRVAAASSPRAVLDDVTALAGGIDAESEARHLVIPDRRALGARLDRFDKSFRELRHVQTLFSSPVSRKQDATTRPETKAYSRIELSARRLAVSIIIQ